jgi:formate dehydrogenase major subunit
MSDNNGKTTQGVTFEIDGRSITTNNGETILQAAQNNGIEIPFLCYQEGMRADGNCRSCVVEIQGERVLAPSCCRRPTEGMVVRANSDRARKSQRLVVELLKSDMPETHYKPDSELEYWANKLDVRTPRFASRKQPRADLSHPAMAVNLDACIQCTRCMRACREEQVNDVIGFAFRGHHAEVVFDLSDPMGESSCVGCGECVQACPTGALAPSNNLYQVATDKKVDSVCPYCGVGCLLTYHISDNRIVRVEGRDGPANHKRLCVKGRYGFDYANHPQRLTTPLIRRDDIPKGMNEHFDPADWTKMFREATWEEALDFAASGLRKIKDEHGPTALAGFGSAKCSNEEAYLFQKLIRTGFGTNNVDHCTRLCHASSVAALLEGIGSGAVSNQVEDVALADVILVAGSNTTINHPVAATFIKNAVNDGKTLIVIDPQRTDLSRHAKYFLQFQPDTDVALFNAMLNVIISEQLYDADFVKSRTEEFEALVENVRDTTPEAMSPICGIDAETIREVARVYATASASIIFWGMGISQHTHGTDNARCLIALALSTGQVGRPGTGLHPLRGQNNVQGASDAGLIPMMFPDYQRVDNPDAHQWFEKYWSAKLDNKPGLTVVEIVNGALQGDIKGMYIMGENPAMSDPNLNKARKGLATLEHVVVQEIFLTETCAFADVVLPASVWPEKDGTVTNTDRRVQLGRKAVDMPKGVRQDWIIIQELAQRLGLDWNYANVAEVYEEMRGAMPSIKGITWERLNQADSVTYPCNDAADPGQGVVFIEDFPTNSGRGKFVPAQFQPAAEVPDDEYPFVLMTGRQLEHWHTGAMTRRASVLDALEPVPVVTVHPEDLQRLSIESGDSVVISSRRGEITCYVRGDDAISPGDVFIPFCYHEAAANLLTNAALDPFGKIPELKYCAVKLNAARDNGKSLAAGQI